MTLERLHPITTLIYFLLGAFLPAFSGNPIFYFISLITGIIILLTWLNPKQVLKSLPGYLIFFVIISLINPLFYHDGDTILFYMNGKRITLEALVYGCSSALMITAVLIWCRSLSHYMTSDKVMFIFGSFSPKTAVIVSMILRFVPLYRSQISSYRSTQRLLGIYGSGTFLERVRGEGLIFAGFLTRILEHSMTTADSMTARGYGTAKRRAFKLFHFKHSDAALLVLMLACASFVIFGFCRGVLKTSYYPLLALPGFTALSISVLVVYFIFAITLPFFNFCFEKGSSATKNK